MIHDIFIEPKLKRLREFTGFSGLCWCTVTFMYVLLGNIREAAHIIVSYD